MSPARYLRRALTASLFLFFAFFSVPFAAQAQPPVEAFGSLPAMASPSLSLDGKYFAMVQAYQGRPVVAIYKVGAAPGTPPALVAPSDGVIEHVQWANNERLVIFLKMPHAWSFDGAVETWRRATAVNVQGRDAVVLLNDMKSMRHALAASYVTDLTPGDENHILMNFIGPLRQESQFAVNLYRVDVRTGRSDLVQYGTPDTADWITDGDGRVLGMIDIHRGERRQRVKLPAGNEWREILSFDNSAGGDSGEVAGVTEDGAALSVLMNRGPTRALMRVDLANPAMGPVLFSNPDYDVDYVLRDSWTRRVIGVAYAADKMEYFYFDPERQRVQRALEAAFPGRSVHAVSSDAARKAYIVATDAPREPVSYYYYDAATRHAYAIGTAYPMLAESDLGEMRPFAYSARDGMRIPAYLTVPPGAVQKNLPLVVMPHGGPEARDGLRFDWWAQFLANRGYAVFQPNFRGSAGYGHAMVRAGFQQWGKAMQDDITDGVRYLIAEGTADPNRICIVGASYGGYAALAGAAFTPELYKCAISFAGVSDLSAMLEDVRRNDGRESYSLSYWESRIGERASGRLGTVSPAQHADQVRAPVLLMHAATDATVPISQSERMRDALVSAGKRVEFLAIEGDDHYLSLAATRIQVLRETERFLNAYIGPARASAAGANGGP